jgi:hypothetical protein
MWAKARLHPPMGKTLLCQRTLGEMLMRWLELHEEDGSPHFVNIAMITDVFKWEGMDDTVTVKKTDGDPFDCIEPYEVVKAAIIAALARPEGTIVEIKDDKLIIDGIAV